MKFLSRNALLPLAAAFLLGIMLISCEDFNVANMIDDESDVSDAEMAIAVEDAASRGSETDRRRPVRAARGCFDLVYPVSLSFPDGTTAVADSAEELRDLLLDWKMNRDSTTTGHPTLVFPVDVILHNGDTVSVQDRQAFKRILKKCGYGKKKRRDKKNDRLDACYDIIFPVDIIFPDSTVVTADSAAEVKQIIKRWKNSNPPGSGRPHFVYPFDVMVLSDSSIVTINNRRQLDRLRDACFRNGRGTRCNNDSTGVGP